MTSDFWLFFVGYLLLIPLIFFVGSVAVIRAIGWAQKHWDGFESDIFMMVLVILSEIGLLALIIAGIIAFVPHM